MTQASATALETYGMVKSWRAAVGIVHTDQITEFVIAGVEVTMLLTNGGYPVVKLLGVATADEVAAGSAGSRGGLGARPRSRRCRRRRRRRRRGLLPTVGAVAGGAGGQWC